MTPQDRAGTRRERLIAGSFVIGFLALVVGITAVYVGGITGLHPRLHVVVPALVRASRILAVGPAALILGASVVVMTVAFIALLIRDARQPEPDSAEPGDDTRARGSRPG